MCGPRQLFFQCGPEMPKGRTPLVDDSVGQMLFSPPPLIAREVLFLWSPSVTTVQHHAWASLSTKPLQDGAGASALGHLSPAERELCPER